jgi:hypothetical protein
MQSVKGPGEVSVLHEKLLKQQAGALVVPLLEQVLESVTVTVIVPVHSVMFFVYVPSTVLVSLGIVPPPLHVKET